MKQLSLTMKGYFDKGKRTKREQFLGEMEQLVPSIPEFLVYYGLSCRREFHAGLRFSLIGQGGSGYCDLSPSAYR